ncbi:serine-rich adhesin for platelets isoform X2 [Parasteatoda tepidariorum]|uniref:serine-rich adhesin for platelets isoform X2 n=1 Tax=Parasteatoda tepidariorum TaxID=114398 RepID=UPI00077FA909|nr:uncharacterized protein LOC107438138 isoform X2 [Parasteatoda tepidariorum]
MPGSTALFQSDQDEETKKSEHLASNKQPPPVVPRRATVTLQSWQSVTPTSESYGDNKHARSSSMDSLESSGSSSSGGGYGISNNLCNEPKMGEYIPTRLATKAPKPPSNPLQFVKVQSPLYKKAELQIKLTKEVKICREALKEGEEEWQSNLDNWKSRRRKVTERVIQRAEEMRQIEADEQLKQEQNLMQQRRIKKFSEMVEGRSARSYSLDLYIGQGDDSGLGGTPEPDDVIDSQCSILRSDTSEGMTSEAESIDSDSHRSDKVLEKEPPVVPKKPLSWLKRNVFNHCNKPQSPTESSLADISDKGYDNNSSTEQSDAEGHVCDSETISSEEDICFVDTHKIESDHENADDHNVEEYVPENDILETMENDKSSSNSQSAMECCDAKSTFDLQTKVCNQTRSFKLCIKPGDNKGFGFSIKGGKDLSCTPCIDSVLQDGPAYLIGLKDGDEIVSLNGELACAYSHASLLFTIKQAVHTGVLDLEISRVTSKDFTKGKVQNKPANKSSFAEKLAKFSSGVNSNSDTSHTSVKTDVKESLVLRRRSAFENGKSEKVIQRRASCLLEETSNLKRDSIEKRFSADFSSQSLQKNGVAKKDPPPPVPVKPKLRPKQLTKSQTIDDSECDSLSQIDNFGANDTTHLPLEPVNNEQFNYVNPISFPDTLQVEETENFEQKKAKAFHSPTSVNNSCFSELSSVNNNITVLNITSQPHKIVHQLSLNIEEKNAVENIQDSCADLEDISKRISSDVETFKDKVVLVNETLVERDLSPIYTTAIEVSFQNVNNSNTSDCMEFTPTPFAQDIPSSNNDVDSETNKLDDIYVSACNPACKDIESINICSTVLESLNLESKEENINELAPPDFENPPVNTNADNVVAEDNPSPLCLSLEKTDDDDGVSASTTTSSDTPDTETVIETLPSNLSPLPNDESNGEETTNHLNNYEEEETIRDESEKETADLNCTATDNVNAVHLSSCTELQRNNIDEPDFSANLDFALSDDAFIDEEEYRRELDESLDQITSLDVIDEIEQRLMQQLEHQDDNFEDINDGLELASEINQDWIYYSEADLLDDLTPKNREPPREPPPPPPVEPEIVTEEPLSLTRSSSTKRIKKELWRRRSDFLGLDSTESGIDVDNIIPPPPGLEEILKLEREQNQWLEKRLLIAETIAETDSSLSTQSTFGDSQDLVPSEYSSSYLLDDEENSKPDFDPSSENWQENLEENVFESDYDSFSTSVSCPIPEESSKVKESPQHKAKQNIQNLGAAPKAKIMDSNKWITERVASISKRVTEPLFRQTSYDQNYWIAQDAGRKHTSQVDVPNRRYSMTSQSNTHPDVTLRTWDDRESEFQKQRPRSAQWNSSNSRISYNSDSCLKQSVLRTQSLNDYEDIECSSDVLESEVHKCSCCKEGLSEGSAMGIEALRLYFHIECFRCCMCQMLLGNGMCGTDVQVKNNQLYCPNCFTVD